MDQRLALGACIPQIAPRRPPPTHTNPPGHPPLPGKSPPQTPPPHCPSQNSPLAQGVLQPTVSWGASWRLEPSSRPPHGPRFHCGTKRRFTKGNVDLGCFWYTTFWTFGFQTPPPPLRRGIGGEGGRSGRHLPKGRVLQCIQGTCPCA